MKKQLCSIVAVASLLFAGIQVHAFVNMANPESTHSDETSLVDRIDAIGTELSDESIQGDEAVAKINSLIEEIDTSLDAEPANEGELLDLRDALVDMRLDLAGEEQVVGACAECGSAPMGDTILSEPVMDGGFMDGGFVDGGYSGGGYGGGGGAVGGGGGIGGFVTSPLGIAAIAGTAIALSVDSDDDDDNTVASN